MDYERAVKEYLNLRKECEAIEKDSKTRIAERRKIMQDIEAWITSRAHEEGLKTVPTNSGTAYWSTHHTCTVASREDFFDYVKKNEAWDLLETRASKLAVKSYIDAHNEAPPGVNFGSYSVMNVRSNSSE